MSPTEPGTEAPRLLAWFRANARDLPWRRTPRDPYAVLASELMLQQTQVERVVPRFEAFMARFPSLAELGAAPEESVVAAWSGLGYYRRARLLHRLARLVAAEGGQLPRTADELKRLPGIGPYTAAAVASMAFDEAVPVLDGNVLRVGARALALESNPRSAAGGRRVAEWVARLMVGNRPGEVNEALMELGAIVCRPRAPRCDQCPIASGCRGRAGGSPELYPPPRSRRQTEELRWVAACVVERRGLWLLRQVDAGPILRGLWLPAIAEVEPDQPPARAAARLVPGLEPEAGCQLEPVRHHITHRRITIIPIRFEVMGGAEPGSLWRWVDPASPGVPTSSLLAKLVSAH